MPLRPRRDAGVTGRATQQRVAAIEQRMAAAQQRVAASVGRATRAVGSLLGARHAAEAVLGTQQKALVGKTSDRAAAGVGAPGIGARPA